MHFWINKPVGRYYGFSGRRYPATPVPKTRSNQYRHSGDTSQMVTPVHRFQSLSSGHAAGPSNSNATRLPRSSLRVINENRTSSASSFVQHSQLINTSNNVTNAGSNQQIISNTNVSGTANRSLLDFSEFTDAELAGYRLRCGVWITFVLATGLVAAAKFYFGHQGPGLEILVFCGLLTLLLSACLYSILCRRSRRNQQQEQPVQDSNLATLASDCLFDATETVRPAQTARQNSPPPYHIAILIPPNSSEAPPPSYDKIM